MARTVAVMAGISRAVGGGFDFIVWNWRKEES